MTTDISTVFTEEERTAVLILIAESDGDDAKLLKRLQEELPDTAHKVEELLRQLRPVTPQ